MASRLYGSTRLLYLQVVHIFQVLHISQIGSPMLVALMGLAVTGYLLLDARPTQTRVTRFLPGRCHDALNRLYRTMPFSTRHLMGCLIAFVPRLARPGYVVLDDVIIEKAFAKRLRWAAWTYSFAKKRKVYGIHVVLLVWCSHDGQWRIPVAFRLLRPKRVCARVHYRTKLQLADTMVQEVLAAGLAFDWLAFDTHYTAGWFTKRLSAYGVTWHGTLDPKTTILWRGQRQAVRAVAPQLRLRWRGTLGLRAGARTVLAPTYGTLRLVVTRNRHGNYQYLVSNALACDLTTMVQRKRRRWSVETVFRDTKQSLALEACQAWVDQAFVRHVALVLLNFVVLQRLRHTPTEPVGTVKERWQLAVFQQGQAPPTPLRACPTELRPTA